jgi:hypothetical protein
MVRRAAVALVAIWVAFALAAPQVGASNDEVRRRGTCTLGSEWRLIVRRETASTLRVRYVLNTHVAGQTWSIFLSMNGVRFFLAQRTTNSEGYIRVTRYPLDSPGDDVIKGASNNQATGETCVGSLTYPF